ncbi:unnamed protein product, partial [Coffea canephora]
SAAAAGLPSRFAVPFGSCFQNSCRPLSLLHLGSAEVLEHKLRKYMSRFQYQDWLKIVRTTTAVTLLCFVFQSNLCISFIASSCLTRIIFSNYLNALTVESLRSLL